MTDKEDKAEEHRMWLTNPHTKMMASLLAEEKITALRILLSRARKSTDPAVSAAYSNYHKVEEFWVALTSVPSMDKEVDDADVSHS